MISLLFVVCGGLAILALWSLVRQRRVKEELDREKRVAELNRQAAKEGRLRNRLEAR